MPLPLPLPEALADAGDGRGDRRHPDGSTCRLKRAVGATGPGDAAHPMLQYLAQGACQALEDAACLASRTARHRAPDGGCDWARALSAYEAARTSRTARVQSAARVWGETWHVDGFARTLRTALFRDRDPSDLRHVDWLYGPQ